MKQRQQRDVSEPMAQEEERDEEISGAQFLCETVIRSLALEEAPDHRPVRRAQHSSQHPQSEESICTVLIPLTAQLYSLPFLAFVFVFWTNILGICFERPVEAEKTAQEGKEEICAVREESSSLLPNIRLEQMTQEKETRPGSRKPS